MMLELLVFLLCWAGAALLLTDVARLHRTSWAARIAPYLPGSVHLRSTAAGPSSSVLAVLTPLVVQLGGSLRRVVGQRTSLTDQLRFLHEPVDELGYRTRQAGRCLLALGLAAVAVALLAPPAPVALCVLLATPLGTLAHSEQRLTAASRHRRDRLIDELPVVTEQLGMLLGAGYSMSAGMQRIADRANGTAAEDLRRVCSRVRHGLSEQQALDEWAEIADVPALDQLVAVLSFDRSTSDLSLLLSDTAATMRDDAHRRLIEMIERRTQQVWIPVTVAALVPGVIFIAVPFIDTLRHFAT